MIAWIIVGKSLPQGVIVPKYEPPAGMSPAAARYLLTGFHRPQKRGAVLVHLAARKVDRGPAGEW